MAYTSTPLTPSVLAQLKENTRLQTSLAEHKIRSDQHRNNFEALRVEHSRLQETCRRQEEEAAAARRQKIDSDQRTREIISKLTEERDYATSLVEQLRTQALTPQREELLREELTDILSAQFRERLQALQTEVDDTKTKLMRAQYDHQYVRTELDHEQKEHQRITAELMDRHRLELQRVSQNRSSVAERLQSENTDYSQRYLAMQRENIQLRAHVVSLENEMEERRAAEATAESKLAEAQENSDMVVTHVKESLKASEKSLDSANRQTQSLHGMIAGMRKEQEQLRLRCQELEVQHMDDTSKLHNAQRQFKNELADSQRQSLQSCSELESRCSDLAGEVRVWRCRAEENEMSVQKATKHLKSKEEELSLRLQAVREEEWRRSATLEQEKLDIETRLSEEERARRDLEEELVSKQETHRQRLQHIQDEKARYCDDAEKLRQHGLQLRERISHLEKERNSLREIDKMYRDLQLQHRSLQGVEQELQASNRHLQSAIEVQQQQLDGAHADARDVEKSHSQELDELRLTNQKQQAHMESRLQELQKINTNLRSDMQKAIGKAKKLKQRGQDRGQEQQEKIELLEARLVYQEQEKAHAKSQLQAEVDQLRYKLKQILRQQGEFNFILHSAGRSTLPPAAATVPFAAAPITIANVRASGSESDHGELKATVRDQDLTSVHRRLAQLSAKPVTSATTALPRDHADTALRSADLEHVVTISASSTQRSSRAGSLSSPYLSDED